jgi:hypothetical protein
MGDGDQPRVSDAVIGAAIGVLLIWLGTLASARLIRWPAIGCGILFVIVMAAFVLVSAWQRLSPPVGRVLGRLRGHVREDPQLGTLTRNVKARCWTTVLEYQTLAVKVIVDGDAEPSPDLLVRARALVADFETLADRLGDYLASEAREWAKTDPELSGEITALRLSAIVLRSADRRGGAMLDFDGPDDGRFWYCDYIDGELSGLSFDN